MKTAETKSVRIKKTVANKNSAPQSWDAFVKTKVDRANERLSQVDQDTLRQILEPKKRV